MPFSRSRRETRDRQSGLLFAWRLPVGDGFRLCMAVVVVALLATGLAAAVRVRIGEGHRPLERRASLVVVPPGGGWRALEMRALEAGPFPARVDLAGDPDFHRALGEAMRGSLTPGAGYEPRWREIADPADAPADSAVVPVLPALPPLAPRPAASPVAATPPVILTLGGAASVVPPEISPPAISDRSRHLLAYLADGRVVEVIGLDPEAAVEAKAAVGGWLRRARVSGGEKEGGWIAVEVEP